jgi:hypothetical protein
MVQRVSTVAFEGIEARAVDVQVQVAPGLPAFAIAYSECQEHRGVCPPFLFGFTEETQWRSSTSLLSG